MIGSNSHTPAAPVSQQASADSPPTNSETAVADTACQSPVFVLTASRSGSTLLRLILDSHPDLACPPETQIGSACRYLAESCYVLEEAGSGGRRSAGDQSALPEEVLTLVRTAVDRAFGRYLERSGKRRWCDKSLDSYMYLDLLPQLYPSARFICLYRHCMDVIASGIEACPWGVSRYGFDAYVARHPGNNIAAIGSYWHDCTQKILEFEILHPEVCHRVRYEDLVAQPEEIAARLFAFLDVEYVPGITQECFRTQHDDNGPGDEKIWFTSGVNFHSVGRGVRVPAKALPAPLTRSINEALAGLDYRLVEDTWNDAMDPVDPRTHPNVPVPDYSAPGPEGSGSAEAGGGLSVILQDIETRARALPAVARRDIAMRWPELVGQRITLAVGDDAGIRKEIELRFPAADMSPLSGGSERTAEPVATMIASQAIWRRLLDGQANLIAEIATGSVRWTCRDKQRLRSSELHATAKLLGFSPIPVTRHRPQSTGTSNMSSPRSAEDRIVSEDALVQQA
jgi:hypothetical protein